MSTVFLLKWNTICQLGINSINIIPLRGWKTNSYEIQESKRLQRSFSRNQLTLQQLLHKRECLSISPLCSSKCLYYEGTVFIIKLIFSSALSIRTDLFRPPPETPSCDPPPNKHISKAYSTMQKAKYFVQVSSCSHFCHSRYAPPNLCRSLLLHQNPSNDHHHLELLSKLIQLYIIRNTR